MPRVVIILFYYLYGEKSTDKQDLGPVLFRAIQNTDLHTYRMYCAHLIVLNKSRTNLTPKDTRPIILPNFDRKLVEL